MHDISRVIHWARNEPWAIWQPKLAEIQAFLARRGALEPEEVEQFKAQAGSRRQEREGSVAVLPVVGTIAQRMNLMMEMSGGTSTDMLAAEVRAAVADPDVSAIVLNIDSPGGTVSGLTELHSQIMRARQTKPVVAAVNSFAASAAYHLASAATEITITPSGEAGSIGVFAMHVDQSEFLKAEGLNVSMIEAPEGGFKTEGNPFEPLSDEARAELQSKVNAFYQQFVADVAKGRGTTVADVRENFGKGRLLTAKDALNAKMVDRIEAFPETLGRLSGGGRNRRRMRSEARRRFEFAG